MNKKKHCRSCNEFQSQARDNIFVSIILSAMVDHQLIKTLTHTNKIASTEQQTPLGDVK